MTILPWSLEHIFQHYPPTDQSWNCTYVGSRVDLFCRFRAHIITVAATYKGKAKEFYVFLKTTRPEKKSSKTWYPSVGSDFLHRYFVSRTSFVSLHLLRAQPAKAAEMLSHRAARNAALEDLPWRFAPGAKNRYDPVTNPDGIVVFGTAENVSTNHSSNIAAADLVYSP